LGGIFLDVEARSHCDPLRRGSQWFVLFFLYQPHARGLKVWAPLVQLADQQGVARGVEEVIWGRHRVVEDELTAVLGVLGVDRKDVRAEGL
jgi:hypothetical protein